MRIRIDFEVKEETLIPYSYQYYLSSWLYRSIQSVDPSLSEWLHQEGFFHHGRRYKPLVFSRLFFDWNVVKKKSGMVVKGLGHLFVDTTQKDITHALTIGAWKQNEVTLSTSQFPLRKVTLLEDPDFANTNVFRTLSPVVVPIRDGERLHYCHPLESRFYDSMRVSLKHWYTIYQGEEPPAKEEDIHISLLYPDRFAVRRSADLTSFKGKNIKGYQFAFSMDASACMKEVAYRTGLGSYGSLGYGMIGIHERKTK